MAQLLLCAICTVEWLQVQAFYKEKCKHSFSACTNAGNINAGAQRTVHTGTDKFVKPQVKLFILINWTLLICQSTIERYQVQTRFHSFPANYVNHQN